MLRYYQFILLTLVFIAGNVRGVPGDIVTGFKAPYSHSTGMTFDGKCLWIADYEEKKLLRVDQNGKVVDSINSPGYWPTGLAWDGEFLWNADDAQNKIYKINPQDGTVMFRIDAPCSNPFGLAWDGETLWVADRRDSEIHKMDLSDGTAIKTIKAPAGNTQGLTFDGQYLWCSDRGEDELYMIDPESGCVLVIGQTPGPYSSGLAWDGSFLWNVDFETDSLYQCVRRDKELYKLSECRYTEVTLKHHAFPRGQGSLQQLNVYVAIPEERPYQKIESIQFSPEDYKGLKDRWDQEFAAFSYHDKSGPVPIETEMSVRAKLYAVDYFIFPDHVGGLEDIPSDIAESYTADGSKYRINDSFIQAKLKEILNDEQRPYYMAQRIYDYVRNTLEYKLEGGWNVAPFVLQRGTGSCSEYTFSFIALCRAAGIPARYVGAAVVRGDDASIDEYFHRWPEVYLPGYGWIPMDPQAGDKQTPREVAMGIGHLPNRFLITTQGGGDSEILGWYYNSNESFITDPGMELEVWTVGGWNPVAR
ncbi:MAG: transglutaminase domain-containing protein [candidate division KSB1 bacterium]|nr:transglutaminase domain-containing protein [candidate division KSB1 bacterium]